MTRTMAMTALLLLAGCNAREPAASDAENAAKPPPSIKLGGVELLQPLRASGTGLGWTLDLAPGDIAFIDRSAADPEPEPFFARSPVVAGDKATWTTRNEAGDVVVVTLTRKDCREPGKAGRTQPLTAELRIGDRVRTGCAGPRPGDERGNAGKG